MIKHRLSLKGPGVKGSRVSAFILKDLLDVLTDGTRGALRLRIEGRSTARGADPAWLGKASDFEIVGLKDGSTVIDIEAAALSEAAPDQFAQQMLFRNLDTSESAFKIFERSLEDAINGVTDSELYDEGLLQTFSRLGTVFAEGIDTVEISNGSRYSPKLTVTCGHVEQVKTLRQETPPPRAVRIAGKINTIRHSDKMFELVLESGQVLRGVAPAHYDITQLTHLFGQEVMVVGKVAFRPSGSILRVEASKIEPASSNVTLWAKAPQARKHTLQLSVLRKQQGPQSGLNRLWGQWPGDESDDQVRKALTQ